MKPGESTKAVISLQPSLSAGPDNKLVQVFLIGLGDTSDLSVAGKKVWDVKGKFGGPESMFADGAIRNAALASDFCAIVGEHLDQIPDTVWTALRTGGGKVNDRDKVGTLATSEIRVKANSASGFREEQVYVISGAWDDGDDNGTAVPDEVGCSGGAITTLTIDG